MVNISIDCTVVNQSHTFICVTSCHFLSNPRFSVGASTCRRQSDLVRRDIYFDARTVHCGSLPRVCGKIYPRFVSSPCLSGKYSYGCVLGLRWSICLAETHATSVTCTFFALMCSNLKKKRLVLYSYYLAGSNGIFWQ